SSPPSPTQPGSPPVSLPPPQNAPGTGLALLGAISATIGAVLVLGLVAVLGVTWRHGYRLRAARTVTVRRSTGGRVRLAAAPHQGLADLDGGWLPGLGWWLRGNGHPRRWAGWAGEGSPPTDPAAVAGIDLYGLRVPARPARRGPCLARAPV